LKKEQCRNEIVKFLMENNANISGIKLFVKKMTKNQESFTSQRNNKIHLFDKNPVFLYMLWGQHANKFDELFNPSG